jgi:hypothetical protein
MGMGSYPNRLRTNSPNSQFTQKTKKFLFFTPVDVVEEEEIESEEEEEECE